MTILPEGLTIHTDKTPGLGDASYVVTFDGVGILIDPQRDFDRYIDRFDQLGAEPRWIFETHLHNDYVSGGLPASQSTGAELVMPAGAAPAFRHTPAFHNEEFAHGPLRIRPLHTPGHTPEHVSYLLSIENRPIAVFSGGSLLVGSAGRSDLLGEDRAESLARLQYISVRRLGELPDETGLYPTHGAGSFCAVTGGSSATSTIGVERGANPVLQYPDADAFVAGQLSSLQPYPTYYRHMGAANLEGGSPIPDTVTPLLTPDELAARLADTTVVDLRTREAFARGHIPGAMGVELQDSFGTWVGWLVDIDERIILVADPDQDLTDAVLQLARIGYDNVDGAFLAMDDWIGEGKPTATTSLIDAVDCREEIQHGRQVLDVRAPNEWDDWHLPDSTHLYVPDIPEATMQDVGTIDPIVVCGSGYRAMIAASLLEKHGISPTVLAHGGVDDLR